MIHDNIRKLTAGIDNRRSAKLSLLLRSAAIVGTALCLGFLVQEAHGVIQKEFLKALAITLGACTLAIMHKQIVNQ